MTDLSVTVQLQVIGIVVLAALLLGALATRLGLSSSVGYIIAGVFLGPLGAGFFDTHSIVAALFSELGITLLLFYLGLEMSLSKFRETGAVATLLAFVQMLFAFVAGFFVAKMFGFPDLEAVVIASLLPMASTVMAVKFMIDRGIIHTLESRIAVSVLIVEDFAGILVLVFLNSLSSQQSVNIAVLNGILFVIAAYYVVENLSKHVLNILSSVGHEDKMALYAIGIGVMVSFVGDRLGLSTVLGAYFAGFALSESQFGERIKKEVGFFREFFILFFFVSFGAAATMPSSSAIFLLLLALVAAYIIVMTVSFGVMGTALGFSPASAVTMGLTLAAIGEFSLIIAGSAKALADSGTLAAQLPHAGDILSLAFLLTLSTSLVMPFLFARSEAITRIFFSIYPQSARTAMAEIGRGMHAVEALGAKGKMFSSYYARTLRSLATNIVIVVSIVYIASLKQLDFSLPWLPLVPSYVTMGMLLLPLIIWPLYRIVNELKILAGTVSSTVVDRAIPALRKAREIERRVSEIFTGLVLSIAGFGVSVFTFFAFGPSVILLAPALYTVISLMFLSKSFYSLMEHYETIESSIAAESALKNRRLQSLSHEFNEHSRVLRDLHVQRMAARDEIQRAIKDEDVERARYLLTKFKRNEARQVAQLLSEEDVFRVLPASTLSRYPVYPASRKLPRFSAKAAFRDYLGRHALNKHELAALQASRARREKIQREYGALQKIKQYLARKKTQTRGTQKPRAARTPAKKAVAVRFSGKPLAFSPIALAPEIKRQEDALAKKLKILPKLSEKFPKAPQG
ncbi:MAG: cation:proton antiporter [Candidatus Micrarchaeia archaeon]|jgi:CPA2 family monovalent cation:H+ antiporter-2